MPYELLERKFQSLPEQSFAEVSQFFDYILYKFGSLPDTEQEPTEETLAAAQEARDIMSGKTGAKRYGSFAEAMRDIGIGPAAGTVYDQ